MDKQIQHTKLEQILTIKKGDMQSKLNKKRIKELKAKMQELREKMSEANDLCVQRNAEIIELMEKSALKTGRTRNDFMDQSDDYPENSKRLKQSQQPKGINYDAVQKAIEEMNIKENQAALKIQSIFRMLIIRRKYLSDVRKFREIQRARQVEREQQARQQAQKQKQQRQSQGVGDGNV